MKKILITSNLIFFLFGNVLLSNTFHLLEHDHNHDHNHYECEECVIIENSSNYILDFNEVTFSNNNSNISVFECISIFELDVLQRYSSRAPPASL